MGRRGRVEPGTDRRLPTRHIPGPADLAPVPMARARVSAVRRPR